MEAQARLLSSLDPVKPGTRAHVRFVLRDPLLLLPGDRFIVRMFSPVVTIGGGVVLDIAPPSRMRRAQLDQRLTQMESGDRVAILVNESKFGMSVADLVARTGMLASEIGEPAGTSRLSGRLADRNQRHRSANRASFARFSRIFIARIRCNRAWRRRSCAAASWPERRRFYWTRWSRARKISSSKAKSCGSPRTASRSKKMRKPRPAKSKLCFGTADSRFRPRLKYSRNRALKPPRARTLLQILLKNRKLIRVGDELIYHASAMDALRKTLAARKARAFPSPISRNGPASRANTPSRCWNSWIANTSRAARANNA